MCGFNDLEREEKITRANEILNSTELKQAICHKILGTTFKDIERAMNAIIDERQLTETQREELELRKSHPEKYEEEAYDPHVDFIKNKQVASPEKSVGGYRTLTREECAALIAASNAPFEPPPPVERRDYPTYTREQVEALMRDHYSYKDNEKKKKEERAQWDSQKTTELDPKIKHPTKRTNSTKT